MCFSLAGEEERRAAIGPTEGLPYTMKKAFDPSAGFEPIAAPGPHDWLANHLESGQTAEEFVRSRPKRPDTRRRTIYLQPLDEFPTGSGPSPETLKLFAKAFFTMEVRILPVVHLDSSNIRSRIHPGTGHRQFLTGDILKLLARRLLPGSYCLVGITLHDLYPDPSWNFVFGEALPEKGVGIYSFARYDPLFYEAKAPGREPLMLRRSCKVLAHETSHLFGIAHCIYFRCLMNGSNHLGESDSRPLHLCPVDLRKLYGSIGFDPVERYLQLCAFCREVGFDDEVRWTEVQLAHLAGC